MNKDSSNFSTHQRWRPMGMSLVTHIALVLLLILYWSLSSPGGGNDGKVRTASIVLAIESDQSETEYLHESDSLDEPETESPQPPTSAAASQAPPALELAAPEIQDLAGLLAPESLVFDANKMSIVPDATKPTQEFQLSPDDLKMIEADRKLIESRKPVGKPTTISVFGSGSLTGRKFVFVLDRSNSMGSGGLGVIQASRKELSAAINQLEPNHEFQIVAYHDRTATMKTRQLLPATAENKNEVQGFIGGLAAFGGTQHENGLIAAIAFRPDVIVLLTDGGYPHLNGGQLKMLKRMSGNRSQIHCIQFGIGPRQGPPNFMQLLADQNNGTYRYIDVNQWDE